MNSPTPTLRPEIDVQPVTHAGRPYYVLYDSAGVSRAQLAVSSEGMFIAAHLDGNNSILDLQDRFARASGGRLLPSQEIDALLQALEQALFLRGEAFEQARRRMREEFLLAPVRSPACAGDAYSNDPEQLGRDLEEMLAGAPPAEEAGPAAGGRRPRGMIIPHIDYVRGAAGYGQAYRELRACPAPAIVVVLGTAHQPLANRIAVSGKDFVVPGGVVPNAAETTRELVEACAGVADIRADEFAHRGETSVELQAVWLHHLWPGRCRIVPVLVGSMHEFLAPGSDPAAALADPLLACFCARLAALADREDVLLVASADLAHVGPRFGDAREVTDALLREVEEHDRAYLRAVARGEAPEALRILHAHHDRYHVCSVGCIHALLQALGGTNGRLLGYHQAANPQMQLAVTYAALAFN